MLDPLFYLKNVCYDDTYLLEARQIRIVYQNQFTVVKLICESFSFGLMENLLIVVISVNNKTVLILTSI